MIIREKVKVVPQTIYKKFTIPEIRQQVRTLQEGEWLPVECDDRAQAVNLCHTTRRTPNLEAEVRGTVCYIGHRKEKK